MTLQWNKCQGNAGLVWCQFLTVNLEHAHFSGLEGVYIIWHGGQSPWTVYVGQGKIADRLRAHREESAILKYSPHGLFVTWARVNPLQRSGVERFLAERLEPRVGSNYPNVPPIAVNLPWRSEGSSG